MEAAFVAERFEALRGVVGHWVVGQDAALRQIFVTLLVGGHGLIEGVPGVAKTLLVRTLARALRLEFGRIQFTPDLMPSDILGTSILESAGGTFRFREGPIFRELLLADEINRASAKTQSALLEAMQEGTVTIDGVRHSLSRFFTVFATQNPVDQEGTYPLPEAELDRFLFKIVVDYPGEEDERSLLRRHHDEGAGLEDVTVVLEPDAIERARGIVRRVTVAEEILAYVSDLVRATRTDFQYGLGASPRAGLWLLRAAKAQAVLDGRAFVLPEDVQEMWLPTLRHRVMLDPALEVEGQTADAALLRTLQGITVPR
ncbi:MAG TPA: MoxR family ATPase [Deltaproteobacteria bacterium]|nr:MoxR family ATPase [Deltaproteobacteria bacterium]